MKLACARGVQAILRLLKKTDTSSNDEGETIAETPPERLSGVPRLERENAFIVSRFPARKKSLMFTPEEDHYLKAGIERYG